MIDRFPSVAAVREAAPQVLAVALAGLDPLAIEGMPAEHAEVVAVATQVVASWVHGVQAVAVTRFAECVTDQMDSHAGELVAARDAQRAGVEARGGVWRGDTGAVALPEPEQVAASMLAAEFRVSPRTMRTTVGRARHLVSFLPETYARVIAGVLEPWRVAGVVQASQAVGFEHLAEFEARLYATDVSGLPKPRLVERAARAALKADPHGAAQAVRRAPARRTLSIVPSETAGLMRWTADVPDEMSKRMFAAVDALAQEYLTADTHTRAAGSMATRSVGAARLDALGDLVMANATVQTVIELVVPLDAGSAPLVTRPDPRAAAEALIRGPRGGRPRGGDQAEPPTTASATVEVPSPGWTPCGEDGVLVDLVLGQNTRATLAAGELERDLGSRLGSWLEIESNPFLTQRGEQVWFVPGPIEAPGASSILPEQVLVLLADADTRVRVRRHDPGGADGPATRRHTYRPGKALAAAVRARDGHCRFPGCSVPATRCHLDHVTPFPAGETTEANLQALCPAHHGFKHHAGWAVTMTPDGDCTWTAPTGRTHTTEPHSRRDHAA